MTTRATRRKTKATPAAPREPALALDALPVVDQHYLPALLQLLDQATSTVDVIAYSFAIGSPKNASASAPLQIARKLLEVRERGVDVRVYIEGRRETAERNRPTAQLLESGGVRVRFGSTHAKGVSVDGRWVLFGSTNFTNQSLTKNIETNLFFSDERPAAGFERYFEHLWNGGAHGGVTLDAPMIADGDFEPVLLEMIDAAEARVDFSIYFFHHTAIQDALIRAQKRGAHVRGLVHNHESFAMSYVNRTRGTVQRLVAGGVTDVHYGPTHLFTHTKMLIIDEREILLGTGNWLHEDVEVHPQLYVRFGNPAVARQLTQHLAATITTRGTPAVR